MDTEVMRGVLIECDAATKIYLMSTKKEDWLKEVNETSVFVLDASSGGQAQSTMAARAGMQMSLEDKVNQVKKWVIEFKHKYSYEKPAGEK
jgi:hypothetical protein